MNPALPAEFEHVVEKALEKDRALRYQSAADLRADLKRIQRASDSGRTASVDPPAPVHSRLKRGISFAVLALLCLLAIGGIAWYAKHSPAQSGAVAAKPSVAVVPQIFQRWHKR